MLYGIDLTFWGWLWLLAASGRMARAVKRADLADRMVHSPGESGGWSPPYELALDILRGP